MRLRRADLPDWLLLLGALRHAAREGPASRWEAADWWRALAPLSPKLRRAVVLVVIRGMRHEDAARYEGATRQAVGDRMERARELMREVFAPGELTT